MPNKQKTNILLPVLDIEHLESFTNGDKGLEKELFNIFCEQGALILLDLENACKEGLDEEWRCFSHKLKGSAHNLGAKNLANLCDIAEENYEDVLEKKVKYLESIIYEFIEVKELLLKRIAS